MSCTIAPFPKVQPPRDLAYFLFTPCPLCLAPSPKPKLLAGHEWAALSLSEIGFVLDDRGMSWRIDGTCLGRQRSVLLAKGTQHLLTQKWFFSLKFLTYRLPVNGLPG